MRVDSKKLENGFGVISDGFASILCFGIGGQSYSNLLAYTLLLHSLGGSGSE